MAAAVDDAKLEAFMGQVLTDMGAIISAPLMALGDRLGLYKGMAGAGPLTSQELADKVGIAERPLREWLRNQAAGGYVELRPGERTRTRCPTNTRSPSRTRTSPFYVLAIFESVAALYAKGRRDRGRVPYRQGNGLARARPRAVPRHRALLPPGYRANLVPMDPGARWRHEKLERGAKVADVGCGHGASTIIMAQAFPNCEFVGFDYHEASIERARARARRGRRRRRVRVRGRSGEGLPRRRPTTSSASSTASTTWATPSGAARARPRVARARRHVDDRRAVRRATASRRT